MSKMKSPKIKEAEVMEKNFPIEYAAKKDFEIHHNDYHKVIKVGDDLKDVPVLYWENLKTEGVL